jgi:hypothetical protein
MSKRLEDFIKANKEEFDELEPKASLWLNIEERLPDEFIDAPRQKKTFSLGFVLKVAASIIVVMGISFVLYLRSEKSNTGVNLAAINPQYAKEQVHYSKLISNRLSQLKTLSKSDPDLYVEFAAGIAEMDSTYKKLDKELPNSPNKEAVLYAMIRNLKMQAEAINQQLMIIEQYNQENKKQQNENI